MVLFVVGRVDQLFAEDVPASLACKSAGCPAQGYTAAAGSAECTPALAFARGRRWIEGGDLAA